MTAQKEEEEGTEKFEKLREVPQIYTYKRTPYLGNLAVSA
jgi:hypothetical protein